MERPSCNTAPASAVLRGASRAARCFHLLILFLKGFVMLCELGVTPASQAYGRGFMVSRNFGGGSHPLLWKLFSSEL